MNGHYRPFVLARAGELAGLNRLGHLQPAISPIFRMPERAWDFDKERYQKSHEDHIAEFPDKISAAWPSGSGYLDLSLIESDDEVEGLHPIEYLIAELASRDVHLVPLINSSSSDALLNAAKRLHANFGRGVAIQLSQSDWTTVDRTILASMMARIGVDAIETDLVIDFEGSHGPITEIAAEAELASLRAIGQFRSVTIGGASFPDLAGTPQGISEYPRREWETYRSIHVRVSAAGHVAPDFFDHVVQNPDQIELPVNPRFISISASLRYCVGEKWLVAKGQLFKGRGPSGIGGAALLPPLSALVRHPEFATPVRSLADDWVEAVLSKSESPGAPQRWREWGTVRHLEVTAFQLASLPEL